MRIKKFSSSRVVSQSIPIAQNLSSENQFTIGLAPVALLGILSVNQIFTYMMINRSTAGQIIRVGFAPSFVPAFGISMLVNEVAIIEDVNYIISAVANGVGALLDCQITWQGLS